MVELPVELPVAPFHCDTKGGYSLHLKIMVLFLNLSHIYYIVVCANCNSG